MAFSGIKNLFGGKSDPLKKEKAFENFEVPEELKFLNIIQMQHLGVPSNATTTLTFDKIQGLLAVGTMDGSLKIFGKEGIEVMLIGMDSNPIELLIFITNKGYLISYSSLNKYLTIWDIRTISSEMIKINFRITKISYDHGDYVYIGTDQGSLRVLNIEEKRLTSYEIKPDILGIDPDPLVDITRNPQLLSKLALVYENKPTVIWDLSSNKSLEKIENDVPLHVSAWSPNGTLLALGRRDGSIKVYKIEKSHKEYKCFRPDYLASDLNVSAISHLYWTETGMVVLGGMPFSSNSQISFISGPQLNDIQQVKIPLKFSPVQLLITPLDQDPENFLVMSIDEILAFHLPECELMCINELYGGSEILTSQFYAVGNFGESLEEVIRNVSGFSKKKMLVGGEVVDSEVYGLLITGHCEGVIRFWTVSTKRIYNAVNMCLLAEGKCRYKSDIIYYDVSDEEICKVSCIELDGNQLFAGFDMGKVGIWDIGESVTIVSVFKYHRLPVLCIKRIEKFIITGDMKANICFFNTETNDVTFEEETKKQILSITNISIVENLVYICYSNGLLRVYNPFQQAFLPNPKVQNLDLKSEVPKRSDFGILKILKSVIWSDTVVLCYEKSMLNCSISDLSVNHSQNWSCPMISCNLAHIRSEVYIYILHADCVISLLEFSTLKRVWKSLIPQPLQYLIFSSNFHEFHMALDGHFIITTSSKALIAGWITMHDEDSPIKPSLFKEVSEPVKQDRKTKSFLGIKYSSEIKYSSLCTFYLVEHPSAKFQSNDSDEEDYQPIKSIPDRRTMSPALMQSTQSAKSAIQETLQKVSERGDKIKSLEEKMQEMSEKSKKFAEIAAEIAKKEKNKKWWQL